MAQSHEALRSSSSRNIAAPFWTTTSARVSTPIWPQIVRSLDSPWVVGGVADHVHILFDMGKTHPPVDFVEKSKREVS
jgi:hypothetical protein